MALVAMGDELEQGAGLDLVLADVGQVVEDDEIELVELVEHRGQAEVASCGLELLDHVGCGAEQDRSEEHTSELQSLMRISYAVFCLKKKKKKTNITDESDKNLQ